MTRHFSSIDQIIVQFDTALRSIFGPPKVTERPNPADDQPESELSEKEKAHTARLMRINHTGEVCAQALYQGQAATAREPATVQAMVRSAQEENDHLDWCEKRINELGGRKSLLNPFWYAGSFSIGALAGIAGDKWSLGFVAETERQVEAHLDHHLAQIKEDDLKTLSILEQMKEDEISHAEHAIDQGGIELPAPIKMAMNLTSKIMTRTVYYL